MCQYLRGQNLHGTPFLPPQMLGSFTEHLLTAYVSLSVGCLQATETSGYVKQSRAVLEDYKVTIKWMEKLKDLTLEMT